MSHGPPARRPCRMTKEHIVVVGGGYAGTVAALRVAHRARKRARVTLVNPAGTFVQRLRLHQIATGQPVAAPRLDKLSGRRAELVEGAATAINLAGGHVEVGGERIGFDRLLLATGSLIDRGVPGAAEHAHALDGAGAARA